MCLPRDYFICLSFLLAVNTLYFVQLGLGLRLGNISHKWESSFCDSLHDELTELEYLNNYIQKLIDGIMQTVV